MPNKRVIRLIKILTGTNTGCGDELFQLEGKLERFTHFWVLVTRSYIRNRCLIRAAALSYSSLLALIPLLAVVIGVTSSLLKEQGEDQIYAGINKFVFSIMPPATLDTNGGKVSLNLNPISVQLADTNAVAGGAQGAQVTHGNNGAEAEAGPNAGSGDTGNTNNAANAAVNPPANEAPVVSISAQKTAAKWIHDSVQNTQGATWGATGMVFLVFIAIAMLSRIEETFNDIWGVSRGRNWLLRIVLYWAVITLGPLLVIGAVGLAGSSQLQAAKDFFQHMPVVSGLFFEFLPLIVLWFAFALVYQLVPNTKVKFSAAFVGGLLAGSLWHLNNVFGFLYVSRVVTNSKIYGSLGLVPVFMAGLYFSWAILLFGAQVAYAYQNRVAYLQDRLAENVNQRGREFVALRLMTCLGLRYQSGERPMTIPDISSELGVPSRLVQQVLQTLLGARLVTETHAHTHESGFIPARPLDQINAWQILLAMRTVGGQEICLRDEIQRAEVAGEFARIEAAEREAATSVSLLALVARAGGVLAGPATIAGALAGQTMVAVAGGTISAAATGGTPVAMTEEKAKVRVAEEVEKAVPEKAGARPAAAAETVPTPISTPKSESESESKHVKVTLPVQVAAQAAVAAPRRGSAIPVAEEERDFPL